MNIAIYERITENIKIEIFYLPCQNFSHKYVIYKTNIEIQSVILFIYSQVLAFNISVLLYI